MQYSHQQSKYLAHYLTRSGYGEEAFTKSMASARVDMNPHQIEAALFALKSPLAKGVILADEVGLGKTIEASLVIAQKWAERKRRVLLITPASLRKQWEQELMEKFSLPSLIIDAKVFKDLKRGGQENPFRQENKIVISSYEFASNKHKELADIEWDFAVYDEAHRLRNVYKQEGSSRAKKLKKALKGIFKILLTATPLQNSLLELYGLVSIIDEKHFGDASTFKSNYTGPKTSPVMLTDLRKRLAPMCKRSLRKEVQEAGHINYTKRIAKTFDFEPHQNEKELYDAVSAYLLRKDTIAFGDKPNQLILLIARKILGSSTFAITKFLDSIVMRLKSQSEFTAEDFDDIDTAEELAEEMDEKSTSSSQSEPVSNQKLEEEISLLEKLRDLAERIKKNAKGDSLANQLPSVLDEIESRGSQRKAVIFTESVKTQMYLKRLLSANGFEDHIVLLNGSNNDRDSKTIYQDWLSQHAGTEIISGSKTADMKAAIVDAFKSDDKAILISTEAGAEGINLQFCSLLVNFDLPWNPQRVEQRIGRIHRYGQKTDVTVVNFLNLTNHAEQRVYELLNEKFNLFSGVFGVSDEVLGAIENGIDFEKQVLEIVQSARTNEEIKASFDELQAELQDAISQDIQNARNQIFKSFDENVVAKLRTRENSIKSTLDNFTRRLINVARAELPDANFHGENSPRFNHEGKTYTTEWPLAEERGWIFFRLVDDNLATKLVEQAKERSLTDDQHVVFDLNQYPGMLADVAPLRGQSGWMQITKLQMPTLNAPREELVLACIADDGTQIAPGTADRLMQVPGEVMKLEESTAPPKRLETIAKTHRKQLIKDMHVQNSGWLDDETARLDAYAEDLSKAADEQIKELEAEIKEDRRRSRTSFGLTLPEKIQAERDIRRKDKKLDKLRLNIYEERKKIRKGVETMLDEIASSLDTTPDFEPLMQFRWTVK
ncbi:MAG: DEAD/DEAH box helicase [Gammaproteobacteria bacterium AqS3]|nr:DEAD/DEAH box helicase [Gammaproteobacteria bacterium AqS3]